MVAAAMWMGLVFVTGLIVGVVFMVAMAHGRSARPGRTDQ